MKMTGLQRRDKYRREEPSEGLLEKAYYNTIDKLIKIIEVKD